MAVTTLGKGRYLLLIDILGFRELIKKLPPEEVYNIIDQELSAFGRWERLNQLFKTIHFSDTFLFYQEPQGYADWAFLDIYALGGMLLSALLAQSIPARGVIAFGDLTVELDSRRKHSIYFGSALIEAYDAECSENWLGITILPSAWKPYEEHNNGHIDLFAKEGVWKLRDDEMLLLNPLIKLKGAYEDDLIGEISCPYDQWNIPEFPNDLKAFRFLNEQGRKYAKQGDFQTKTAQKYHSTIKFLKDILPEGCFEWADRITTQL